MGHSTFTHASTYSSERVGSEEAHFNAYHFALGDTSYGFSRCQNILSLANLRSAMQLRYPTSSTPEGHNYLSLQQKELVEFGYGMTFTKPQHCVALLAPGEGKSECYIIPTIARPRKPKYEDHHPCFSVSLPGRISVRHMFSSL
ncbi:hypothetical protein MHU86_16390 [Fragilaria crotonensis]|nr:hypothetical protein MHU86_16390 [Fragilaria crotonensis]